MRNQLDSYYIKPFLEKSNDDLVREIKDHQSHNAPLSEKQKRMEGETILYGRTNEDYDGNR